jgi:hypothetical protein
LSFSASFALIFTTRPPDSCFPALLFRSFLTFGAFGGFGALAAFGALTFFSGLGAFGAFFFFSVTLAFGAAAFFAGLALFAAVDFFEDFSLVFAAFALVFGIGSTKYLEMKIPTADRSKQPAAGKKERDITRITL